MSIFLKLISDFAWAFYIACGIAGVYFLLALFSGWRDYGRSAYYLERETSRSRMSGALLRFLFCGLIAGGIWLLVNQSPDLAPATGAITSRLATPVPAFTPNIVFAPGAGPNAPNAIEATAIITRAAGLAPPTPITQTASSGLPNNNCGSQMAQILAAEAPRKMLTITGTVMVEPGGQWRVEFLPSNNLGVILVQRGDTSVSNAALVRSFGVSMFQPGTYGVRVVSVKADGSVLATCQRSVGLGN